MQHFVDTRRQTQSGQPAVEAAESSTDPDLASGAASKIESRDYDTSSIAEFLISLKN